MLLKNKRNLYFFILFVFAVSINFNAFAVSNSTWTQSSWAGGINAQEKANITSNSSNWTKYEEKTSLVSAGSTMSLSPTSITVTENFSTLAYKDAVNTTANWNVAEQQVKLPASSSVTATDLHRTPTSKALYATYFATTDIGFAVGEKGRIFKTINGGTSWTNKNTNEAGASDTLYDVFFRSSTLGWAVGGVAAPIAPDTVIYKTTDSGETWTRSTITQGNYADSVVFLDDNTGVLATDGGKAYRTTDGGTTWTLEALNGSDNYNGISFSGTNVAIAVNSNGNILFSTDSGDNWTTLATALPTIRFNDVILLDANTMIIAGGTDTECNIIKGTKVADWTWLSYGFGVGTCSKEFTSLTNLGAGNLLAVGTNDTVFKTTNSGTSWTSIPTSVVRHSKFHRDVFFKDANNGWIVGDSGTVIKTTNGGTAWSLLSSNFGGSTNSLSFIDANTGFSAASGNPNGVYKTTDGGSTWSDITSAGMTDPTNSVSAIDSNTLWVSHDSNVYKSSNGGGSFDVQTFPPGTSGLQKLFFKDANNGWIVGNLGAIYATTNGGTSWQPQTSNYPTKTLGDVFFTDANNGWVIGSGGGSSVVIKTTNGGANWTDSLTEVLNNLNSIFFLNANTGWITSNDSPSLLKTEDGGTTWTTVSTGFLAGIIFNSIYFADSNIGFIAGDNGFLAKTTDGGTTWSQISTTIDGDFKSIRCATSTTCFAGGLGGSLVKLTVGAGINYQSSGTVQSLTMDSISQTIVKATLTATQTLNSQSITYYLSANGGTNWEEATSGVEHTFTNTGSDLKWKATLSTTNVATTPIISNISLSYSYYAPVTDSYSATDTFDATTNKDATTTAKWDGNGSITLDGGFSSTVSTLSQRSPTTYTINKSYFIDANTGWIGANGTTTNATILKTANGGSSWTAQNPVYTSLNIGQPTDIKSVFFVNSSTGWAVGTYGAILKTTDGGTTWTSQTSPTVANYMNLESVYFTDVNTGWIAGDRKEILSCPPQPCTTSYISVIHKTTDGGITWTTVDVAGLTSNLKDVFFINSNTGWATGSGGKIIKTINGGTIWSEQTSGETVTLQSVHFIDENTGWFVGHVQTPGDGNAVIRKTTDGGTNWTAQGSGTTDNLNDVYFSNTNNGWAVGFDPVATAGVLLSTANGGATWTAAAGINTADYYGVFFPTASTGYIVGSSGTMFKTVNSGSLWTEISTGFVENINDVFYVDSNTGWAIAFSNKIYKTTNNGSSWTLQTTASYPVSAGHFFDANNGIVVGGSLPNVLILKTTNGGTSWDTISPPPGITQTLVDVYFANSSIGWAVGNNAILKTTNGGTSWTEQNPGSNINYTSVYALDQNNVWIVGKDGSNNTKVGITTDGGSAWSYATVIDIPSVTPKDIFFIDSNTGWIVENTGGSIFKTTNGGTSWVATVAGMALNSVRFISSTTGWAVGNTGLIKETTNGGSSWSQKTSGIEDNINKIFCVTSSSCRLGTDNGKLLSLTNSSDYSASGIAQSSTLDSVSQNIISATLTATQTLNGQTITHYLSANGGTNWEQVTSGTEHTFTNTGSDLRWKATLSTANIAVTPSIADIAISYSITPAQSLTSSWFNSENSASTWSSLAWTETLPINTDIKFQIRTAPNLNGAPDTANATTFCGPDNGNATTCSTVSYFTAPLGSETIDNIMRDGVNDQWIQYKVYFVNTSNTTPTLSQVILTYSSSSENTVPIAPSSGFSPSGGQTITSLQPTIEWGSGSDATDITANIHYIIRLGANSNPSVNYSLESTTADGRLYYVPTQNLINNQTYYYTVKSVDTGGLESDWSAVQYFTVMTSAPTSSVISAGGGSSISYYSETTVIPTIKNELKKENKETKKQSQEIEKKIEQLMAGKEQKVKAAAGETEKIISQKIDEVIAKAGELELQINIIEKKAISNLKNFKENEEEKKANSIEKVKIEKKIIDDAVQTIINIQNPLMTAPVLKEDKVKEIAQTTWDKIKTLSETNMSTNDTYQQIRQEKENIISQLINSGNTSGEKETVEKVIVEIKKNIAKEDVAYNLNKKINELIIPKEQTGGKFTIISEENKSAVSNLVVKLQDEIKDKKITVIKDSNIELKFIEKISEIISNISLDDNIKDPIKADSIKITEIFIKNIKNQIVYNKEEFIKLLSEDNEDNENKKLLENTENITDEELIRLFIYYFTESFKDLEI